MSIHQKIIIITLLLHSTISFAASAAPRPISSNSVQKLLRLLKDVQTERGSSNSSSSSSSRISSPASKNIPSLAVQRIEAQEVQKIITMYIQKANESFSKFKGLTQTSDRLLLNDYEHVALAIGKCYEPFIVFKKGSLITKDSLAIGGQFLINQDPILCDIFAKALTDIQNVWEKYKEKFPSKTDNVTLKMTQPDKSSIIEITKSVKEWMQLTQAIHQQMVACGTEQTAKKIAQIQAKMPELEQQEETARTAQQAALEKEMEEIKAKITKEMKQKNQLQAQKAQKQAQDIESTQEQALSKLIAEEQAALKQLQKEYQKLTRKEVTINTLEKNITNVKSNKLKNSLSKIVLKHIDKTLKYLNPKEPNKNEFLKAIKETYRILLNQETQSHIYNEQPYLELPKYFNIHDDNEDITLLKYALINLWNLATIVIFNDKDTTPIKLVKILPAYSIEEWKILTERIGDEGLDVEIIQKIDPTYKVSTTSVLKDKVKAITQSHAAQKVSTAAGSAWQSLTSGLRKMKTYLTPTIVEIEEDFASVDAEIAKALEKNQPPVAKTERAITARERAELKDMGLEL